MLQRLGLKALAYDWRDEHLGTFDEELYELQQRGIRMTAFWWRGGWPESAEAADASPVMRASLDFFERNHLQIEVWCSCKGDDLADLADEEAKYAAAARRVDALASVVNGRGCRLGLYNHGGWGGMPRNMIEIVKRLSSRDAGIVYNFHHGHEHLEDMPEAFQAMLPYLTCVNLNGMTADGPKILPLGQGEEDLKLLKMIRDSGYEGTIGILDHRMELDAEQSLRENLEGLQNLLKELGEEAALRTYT